MYVGNLRTLIFFAYRPFIPLHTVIFLATHSHSYSPVTSSTQTRTVIFLQLPLPNPLLTTNLFLIYFRFTTPSHPLTLLQQGYPESGYPLHTPTSPLQPITDSFLTNPLRYPLRYF